MLSVLTSVPSFIWNAIPSFFWWVALGYCACIIFPMPWLTPWVLGLWTKVLGLAKDVENAVTPAPTPTPVPVPPPVVPPAA